MCVAFWSNIDTSFLLRFVLEASLENLSPTSTAPAPDAVHEQDLFFIRL